MTPTWGDVNARVRGLSGRLLTRAQLEALTRCPDLPVVGAELRRLGFLVPDDPVVSPAALDLTVRRAAAARLRTLQRWCGPRTRVLAGLFEDEDRRSLRAILRGVTQGGTAPPEARLAGLVPTPTLPERALAELARQPSVQAVAALLVAWGNPYGHALMPAASATQPTLLTLELSLSRAYAARARAAARRAGEGEGGRALVAYVQESLDLENAFTALVLTEEGKDVVPKDAFLAGGARVSITVFETAVAAAEPAEAGRRLAAAFAGSPLAAPFRLQARAPAQLEQDVLRIRTRSLTRQMRRAPLGPVPLVVYLLRLRAQVLDLRRIIWGVALGAPRPSLAAELVTA